MISIVCPTYGRPRQLEELISCFLRRDVQDCHLFIVNDHPRQRLIFNHPEVTVINKPVRYPSLGEKRQDILSMIPSGLWTTWDDDDIYLPGYLSYSLELHARFRSPASKHMKCWQDSGKRLYRIVPAGWMNTVLCDRDLFLRDSGFQPGTNNSCVPAISSLLRNGHLIGPGLWDKVPPTFIYRIDNGRSHCCIMPEETARDLVAAAADPVEGDIELIPHWEEDYAAKAANSWQALAATL